MYRGILPGRGRMRNMSSELKETAASTSPVPVYMTYGWSTKAHSKICSYCSAAWSHVWSFVMPRFMSPSQDGLCSLNVDIAVRNAHNILSTVSGENAHPVPSSPFAPKGLKVSTVSRRPPVP